MFESRIEKTEQGKWIETKTYPYTGFELEQIRFKFGKMVFEYGQKFKPKSDGLEIIAFTWNFRNKETVNVLNADFKNIGFVFIGCLAYMTIHTGSLFIAFTSLINILMSVPIALIIYRYAGHITYFSSLHLSVIIIVIGVGADDVFVFHDFWKNTF